MSLKDAFKPSSGKILAIIIIFALIATYGFVPTLTSSKICVSNCSIEIGYPFKFFFYTWGVGTETFTDFNIFVFIIDILVFYLALCLISLILKIGRKEHVSSSYSGGRDSSTTQ
jgi:hypothetical protein